MPFLTKPQWFAEGRTWDVSLKDRYANLYTTAATTRLHYRKNVVNYFRFNCYEASQNDPLDFREEAIIVASVEHCTNSNSKKA